MSRRRWTSLGWIALLAEVVACAAPAPPGATASAREPATSGEPAARPGEGPELELVDAGAAPLSVLAYELGVGTSASYLIRQQLTLVEKGALRGELTLSGPLRVRVLGNERGHYALALELGPLELEQRGDTAAIGIASANPGSERAEAALAAELELAPSGAVLGTRLLSPRREDPAMPVLETLLGLEALPTTAVGAGARWRTRRRAPTGDLDIATEHEMLSLAAGVATIRVWRKQLSERSDEPALGAMGEWHFAAQHWPLTGHDRLSFVPPAPPDARVSVLFEVKHADQNEPAPPSE